MLNWRPGLKFIKGADEYKDEVDGRVGFKDEEKGHEDR